MLGDLFYIYNVICRDLVFPTSSFNYWQWQEWGTWAWCYY